MKFRRVFVLHKARVATRGSIVLLVCGALVFIGCAFTVWMFHRPQVHGSRGRVQFVIHRGDSLQEIAASLESEKVIKSAFWFRAFLRLTGQEGRIQAGFYHLPPGDSYRDLARRLTNGQDGRPSVRVTIPEGYTVSQIGQRLQSLHICSKESLCHEEHSDVFALRALRQADPNFKMAPNVKHPLEGYLFPDTYVMCRGEAPAKVVQQLVQNFVAHVSNASTLTSNGNLQNLITKASLVEREAKVDSERPIIAGIIENRLRKNMPLQLDATVQYAQGVVGPPSASDLRKEDPYNTYLHKGLPPGPIANPGMASILAVMHPAKTEYLYYVVRNDGSGRNYFATDYRSHLMNVSHSEANLRAYLRRQTESKGME